MEWVQRNGRRYGRFERLARLPGLVHAFTTRPDDVSPRSDARAVERTARRQRCVADWGLEPAALRYCIQVHEDRIACIVPPAAGEPPHAAGPLPRCDGALTMLPGVPLMTFSADCPLVLVTDPVRRAVGLAHASWRCTVRRIVERLVAEMIRCCGSRPADLHAGIGPGAGPCCYEVQSDVYAAAETLPDRDALFARRDGRMYFDLWAAARGQLARAGVPADQIEAAGVCTLCHNDVLYSFRREGPGCGHFGLLAAWTG